MSEYAEPFDIYSIGRYWFTPEDVERLMVGSRTISLKKGEVLYRAEESGSTVYYLRKGKTKFHMLYPDGGNRITAYSEAPGFVSIINILPGHLNINNCTAVTNCTISACSADVFMDRVRELGLMEKLFQYAIGTSRHIYTSLTVLLTEDRLRLVDTLRNQQKLTLQEVADFIGCSRVHVSRICKQLEQQRSAAENPDPHIDGGQKTES
ncbi:MAG: Crp/Fnr family transcriptional regulator [Oscillospiraceae bacterium]|nr:Crp/Fnr family transcriptional regulator [Oscillospiraceae bacterium]